VAPPLIVEWPLLELHLRGWDAEAVLAHRNSGHYLEAVPILHLMVNGQAGMDPLHTTPPNPPLLHDPLRMVRATPTTAILRELPSALATQKTAIPHELPSALVTQKTAIPRELPLALATRTTIPREILNMTLATHAILEGLLNMAPATAQTATIRELPNMALAAVADPPPHLPPPHTTGSEVDSCVFPLPLPHLNGSLINLSVLCILHTFLDKGECLRVYISLP